MPPTLYATTEQLQRRLHTSGGGGAAADPALLGELLEAACGRVREQTRDRTLAPLPALETDPPVSMTFPVHGSLVQVPDLRELVSITLDGYAPGYSLRTPVGEGADLRHLHVRLRGQHYRWHHCRDEPGELTIVGRWGPSAVEPDVRDAVLTWAARAWHARTARFADAVQDPAGGFAGSYFKAVPSDVAVVLNALQVPGL